MQAIKDKLSDMSAMRQAKAEAKEEEKAEKEIAKSRVEVAHEVRMAREAEAAMDLHVNKAAEKVVEHDRKHLHQQPDLIGEDSINYGTGGNWNADNINSPRAAAGGGGGGGFTARDPTYGGSVDPTAAASYGRDATGAAEGGINTTGRTAGTRGTRSNNNNNWL